MEVSRRAPEPSMSFTDRILFLHQGPPRGTGYGGAERYLELLADGLRTRGIETAAVIFGIRGSSADELADRLTARSVSVVRVTGPPRPRPIARLVRSWRPMIMHWNQGGSYGFHGGMWLIPPWFRPSVVTDHIPGPAPHLP